MSSYDEALLRESRKSRLRVVVGSLIAIGCTGLAVFLVVYFTGPILEQPKHVLYAVSLVVLASGLGSAALTLGYIRLETLTVYRVQELAIVYSLVILTLTGLVAARAFDPILAVTFTAILGVTGLTVAATRTNGIDDHSLVEDIFSGLDTILTTIFHRIPLYHHLTKWVAPVGRFVVDVILRYPMYVVLSLPVLVPIMGVAAFVVGTDVAFESLASSLAYIEAVSSAVRNTPPLLGLTIAAVYLLGLLRYVPFDRQGFRRGESPSHYYSWEQSSGWFAVSMLPVSYYIFLAYPSVFDPVFGGSLVAAFWAATVIAMALAGMQIRWIRFRYIRDNGGMNQTYTTGRDFLLISFIAVFAYFVQIPYNADLLLMGSPDEPLSAVVSGLAVVMFWAARRLRWALYEDAEGMRVITPYPRVWNIIARVPFVFAVYVLLVGDSHSLIVGALLLSPAVATASYLMYRWITTGDMLTPTDDKYGFNPGEPLYEQRWKEIGENSAKVYRLSSAVKELNDVLEAEDREITLLPTEPDGKQAYYKHVRKELKTVHAHEKTNIEAQGAYAKHRRRVKEALEEWE